MTNASLSLVMPNGDPLDGFFYSRVMINGDPEKRNFLSYTHTHDGILYFISLQKTLHQNGKGRVKST